MNETTIIEVKELSISFPNGEEENHVLKNISFSISKGKCTGILGESGSGKTMTALAIMNLLPPGANITSGEILFYPSGKEALDLLRTSYRSLMPIRGNRISIIFQEPMSSLNPVHSCGRQVDEILCRHLSISSKKAKKRTLDLFREVHLQDPERTYSSYPYQLSGGQQQRVMIAMAVACKPDLLIADEPTTALDVTVQKNIISLLNDLRAKYHISLLFISHDIGVLNEVADDIIVMYQGEIVETGPISRVLTSPEHLYTKGLSACRPGLSTRLYRLPSVSGFSSITHSEINQKAVPENSCKSDQTRKQRHIAIYSAEPLLRVRDLKVDFPVSRNFFGKVVKQFTAVNNISFDLFRGETLGVVGESGCGKTTLGRSILNLIESSQGTIEYNGKQISSTGKKMWNELRKKIQIIFQDPYSSLNPRLTVGKTILEPMRVHGILSTEKERKSRMIELLNKVNLDPLYANRFPHELSGGQRQRISIARAIALEPEFIICDEAVSSLDVSIQAQVLNLLNDLKEDFGLTYIFISHDLAVVKYMSDRIMVMKDGALVEIGESDKIYQSPSDEYTKKLIESIPGS